MQTRSLGCCVLQIGSPFDHWAATLFTYIKVPSSATYTVSIASDNGAMVWIEDTLVVNNTGKLWCLNSLLVPASGVHSNMYCLPFAQHNSVAPHPERCAQLGAQHAEVQA